MSELETLNMLLRLIGSSAVNVLETDHPDAANARATMLRISRRAQRKGWWFNIDYNVELQPNSNNEIEVNKSYSSVVIANTDIVTRGDRLYNRQTQDGRFEAPVIATRIVKILEWDDMPEVMTEYCAYLAASEFVRDELEDPQKEASLAQSATGSFMDLKKQELEEGQYNIFNKPRVRRVLQGIQPIGRYS